MSIRLLSAEWRKLVLLNYEIAPGSLSKHVPHQTELDYWNGTCYLSLVGFMFLNTKVIGMGIPFHINFEEVNLRFYNRYKDNSGWKRGVVFIKEIVPRRLIAGMANLLYGENYERMAMTHEWKEEENGLLVEYGWKKDSWNRISVIAENRQQEIPPDSEEEFITEHYWGYTRIDDKKTAEYAVEHPRWQVYRTKSYSIEVDFGQTYGEEFAFLTKMKPKSVFLAEGSEVAVFKGTHL